jgi:anion-transporting  ArsA/GET3 family ATPase
VSAADRTSLAATLRGKRLVVLVGQGGVGKTSASAAIAYGMATGGQTVSVLTVDPAPRLGDALGIATIGADPQNVALPKHARGSLTAMRLDTKRTFDRMIEENSPSPAVTQKLLAHPIYRAISEQLGGTENYMAFQRLHELVEHGGHDCLVVDTPPAINAADLLAAPSRLAGLLDTGALSILAEPAKLVARTGGVIARATISIVIAAIGRVTGTPLQREVGQFVELFSDLVGGLEDRARAILDLLRAPATAFVLVTRPRESGVEDALTFRASLEGLGIRVAAIVVNRVTPARSERAQPDAIRLAALSPRQRAAVIRMEADMDALRALERTALERLRRSLCEKDDPPIFELTARDVDIASLSDIAILARDLGG